MKKLIIYITVIIGLSMLIGYGINVNLHTETKPKSNYEKFKSEWYDMISQTKYKR